MGDDRVEHWPRGDDFGYGVTIAGGGGVGVAFGGIILMGVAIWGVAFVGVVFGGVSKGRGQGVGPTGDDHVERWPRGDEFGYGQDGA